MKTIIEPFKIKMVEPLKMTTREQRLAIMKEAGYNPFNIRGEDVLIDLLTDSGTGSMSHAQWAEMMMGDESYAGARSFYKFEAAVKEITGMQHVIPTHQGRASERILFSILGSPDMVVPSNTHFDTTRANIEFTGARAVDLIDPRGLDPHYKAPFKGNMDTDALDALIREVGPERIPVCMITVTNNASGGQPVSMANIRKVREITAKHGIPLFIDACRFAENAYFIKQREEGYADKDLKAIAREMFSYADGATFSAKKDGLANIGGFLAINNDELAVKARNLLILTEGFPTYGGLAGRDLGAIAQGLKEVLDEDYMRYRIRSTEYLGENLIKGGVPIFEPPGGHAIYIDAKGFLPHIPASQFPGQALVGALYIEGGIRAVEIGSVMFGRWEGETFIPAKNELVRLAIPRRVYTQSHIDYVIEVVLEVFKHRDQVKGLKIVKDAPYLRHFTALFAEV